MTFVANTGEWIWFEVPLTQVPTFNVSLHATVQFPDAAPLGLYKFPALYYEIEGPGIDPAPRLINQDASLGGDFVIEAGATVFRVKLKYDASLGPFATTAKGDIRRSLIQVNGANGVNILTLKDRVWQLILDCPSSTIVNMFTGTVMGQPHITTIEDQPILEKTYYIGYGTDALSSWAYFWAKYEFDHPLENDISFCWNGYLSRATTVSNMGTDSNTVGDSLGVFRDTYAMGSGRTVSVNALYSFDENNNWLNTSGFVTSRKLVAGTKFFLSSARFTRSVADVIMQQLPLNGGCCYAFMRAAMEVNRKDVGITSPSRSWRIPHDTYVHARFFGDNLELASWSGLTTGREGGL